MKSGKFILLSVCSMLAFSASFAQVRTDINSRERNNTASNPSDYDYNAHDYCIGVGLGMSKMYGDLPYSNPQPVYCINLGKNVAPNFSITEEVQIGDISSKWPTYHLRAFNHFFSLNQNVRMELGVFLKNKESIVYKILGGVYGSIGVGLINNNIIRIANVSDNEVKTSIGSTPQVLTNSTALFIPYSIGINVHLRNFLIFKNCMFYGNYQINNCFSDYVDGYKLNRPGNTAGDVFTVASVGFRFYIFPSNSNDN